MANELIKLGQQHSVNFTGCTIDADGVYGPLTKANGIRCIQVACNLDYGAGLDVDGEFGPATAAAINGHFVRLGETQYLATAVEILLLLKGYDPLGVESPGVFGEGLDAAVRKFQEDVGIEVDGIAGTNTLCHLMDVEMISTFNESGEWQQYDASNLPNFGPDEFKCQCGCGGDVCDELKCKAQLLRDKLTAHYGCDMPMTITSGYRCYEQNIREGGITNSLHSQGQAFDFQIFRNGTYRMDAELINTVKTLAHECGMGVGTYYETGFVHCQNKLWDYEGD